MAQASTMSYEVVEGWEQLPAGWEHRDVAGVAVDAESRVYLICRGEHPIIVYDSQGNFLRSWGEGDFTLRTHGITVGPDGTVYATDDGNHTVRQFTPDGKLLMTLGTLNTPSDTGYDGKRHGHRNQARRAVQSPDQRGDRTPGDVYVSDGYGNCRVHRFSPTGELKRSWGVAGQGPGEFLLPHGIAVAADGRVFVCDRENDRIQIFSPDGEYLAEWTDTRRPTHLVFDGQGRAYVSELWWQPAPDLPALRIGRGGPRGPRQRLRPGRARARALGRAGPGRGRQLRGPPRHRRGFEERRVRERGHLDVRGQPRPRAGGLPYVPEVRAAGVGGLAAPTAIPPRISTIAATSDGVSASNPEAETSRLQTESWTQATISPSLIALGWPPPLSALTAVPSGGQRMPPRRVGVRHFIRSRFREAGNGAGQATAHFRKEATAYAS